MAISAAHQYMNVSTSRALHLYISYDNNECLDVLEYVNGLVGGGDVQVHDIKRLPKVPYWITTAPLLVDNDTESIYTGLYILSVLCERIDSAQAQ